MIAGHRALHGQAVVVPCRSVCGANRHHDRCCDSDVGGGYWEEPALSDISLKWMTVAATSAGLHIRSEGYPRLREISSGHATAEVHRAGPFWALCRIEGDRCPVALLYMPASATVFEQFRHTAT
jgi:hypothetical protein